MLPHRFSVKELCTLASNKYGNVYEPNVAEQMSIKVMTEIYMTICFYVTNIK